MIFLFFISWIYAQPPEHIYLKPGEQTHISMNSAGDIKVSRKGVVHLSAGEKPDWLLTALHRGRVVIQSFNLDHSVEKEFFIEVHDLETAKPTKKTSEVSIGQLKDLFEQEFKVPVRFLELSSHHKILSIRCVDEEKSVQKFVKILESLNLDDHIAIVCEHWLNPQYFKIQSKVVVRAKGSHFSVGSDYKFMDSLTPQNLDAKIGILPHARESQNETKIIGEPVVFVGENDGSTVKSGGEIPYEKETDTRRGHSITWKEYGMQMDAQILAVKEMQILTTIDFQLRHRQGEGNLSLNQIKTKAFLKLDRPSLIGTAQLSSADDNDTSVPFLASIPIVGPFFHLKKDSSSNSQLELWATISKVDWSK